MPEGSVRNQMERTIISVWSDRNFWVHFDRSNQSDRNVPFHLTNRPLALRGHVTNTSLKQLVGVLLMPKIERAHKNYLTPKIWEEKHLREIFYGTLIFYQRSIINIVLAAILEGILLPSNMVAKTTFCLHVIKRLTVTLRCAVSVTTSFFQHFLWSLSAKFVFRRR